MLIRPATVADRDAVAALHVASWQDAYGVELPPEVLRDEVPGYLRDKWAARTFAPPEVTLVAEDGGTLAGLACALIDRDPPLIDNLHVRPGMRGQGTGARLLAAMREALRDAGFARAYLTVLARNPRAHAFYLAQGGVDEGAEEDLLMGRPAASRRIGFELHPRRESR